MRVATDPHGAVGALEHWDHYGDLQLEFLIERGLRAHHRLLDVGCGTGRLARKAAPYLDDSRYVGVDLSGDALDYALALSKAEGWSSKKPWFVHRSQRDIGQFDFIWAFSVFIHVPIEIIEEDFLEMANRMHSQSQFLFSFVHEKREERTGTKQFRHVRETYESACRNAGLQFDWMTWPGKQQIGLATL